MYGQSLVTHNGVFADLPHRPSIIISVKGTCSKFEMWFKSYCLSSYNVNVKNVALIHSFLLPLLVSVFVHFIERGIKHHEAVFSLDAQPGGRYIILCMWLEP